MHTMITTENVCCLTHLTKINLIVIGIEIVPAQMTSFCKLKHRKFKKLKKLLFNFKQMIVFTAIDFRAILKILKAHYRTKMLSFIVM